MLGIQDAPAILFAYCGARGMRDEMQGHSLQIGAASRERGAAFRKRGASYGVLKSAEEARVIASHECVWCMHTSLPMHTNADNTSLGFL